MATFEYKGYSEAGRLQRGLIEALDRKEAREKLARRGILTESVAVAGRTKSRLLGRGRHAFDLEARAMIYRELGALVHAGLPLAQALDLLVQSPETGEDRSILAAIHDRIREGVPLAEALRAAGRQVSSFEAAVVDVGERTGELDTVLERLAEFLEEQQGIRERIVTAMIYPTLVIVLALGIGLAVLGIMVPRIGAVLLEADMQLPTITIVMLGLARGVARFALPGLAAAGLVGWLVVRRWRAEPGMRSRIDRWLFRLPWIGRTYAALVALRFSRTLALLLRGGVPLVEGLPLAGRATGSPWLEDNLDVETEAVRHGRSLADALRNVESLRAGLPGWVEAGETSGDLSGLLEHAGQRYQRYWDRQISRMLALLEPVLVLIIGVFVLFVALAILLPILSMNQQIR
jgi:general secretion pathway protein F